MCTGAEATGFAWEVFDEGVAEGSVRLLEVGSWRGFVARAGRSAGMERGAEEDGSFRFERDAELVSRGFRPFDDGNPSRGGPDDEGAGGAARPGTRWGRFGADRGAEGLDGDEIEVGGM